MATIAPQMLFGELEETIWEPSGNNTKMGETSGEIYLVMVQSLK